jgi:hypothetical protein
MLIKNHIQFFAGGREQRRGVPLYALIIFIAKFKDGVGLGAEKS